MMAHAEVWIAASDYASIRMVQPEGADALAVEAADLFAEYWTKCTGEAVERGAEPLSEGVNVWIGAASALPAFDEQFSLSSLKWDGIVIETLTDGPRKDLILAGGPGRGTVYAVYEFFERAFGVRWLAPDTTHIPEAPAQVAALHVRYEPPFFYRITGLPSGANSDAYRNASKLTYGFGGHSLFFILPPEEYFAEHPEYYSELNGERVAPVGYEWRRPGIAGEHPEVTGQLCMTNPATAEAIAHVLAERIRQNPSENVQSVSQMDWGGNCTCPVCREIDEQEGTPAASMLIGVNRVAELIEKEFPGTYIQTYAYTWTRKPPKTIRPRHNVIVQLCTFECDFSRTLDNPASDANAAFLRDLRGWQEFDTNLLFYDYPNNCDYLPRPYPNFHVVGPYIRTFAESGGIGVLEQCTAGRLCALGYLRPYLLSKLMWDPSLDADTVIDEFLRLYYGKAAPYIRQYIDLSRDTLVASEMPMYLFDHCAWITPEYARESEALFQKALEAAENDTIRERVDLAHFSVQYTGFLSKPVVEVTEDALLVSLPVTMSKAGLRQRLEALKLDQEWPHDWPTIESMFKRILDVDGPDPLRIPIHTIENDRYVLSVAPSINGSILRWHDKQQHVDFLKGYEWAGVGRGTWQDWTDRNAGGETPIAGKYDVVEHTKRRLVMESVIPDGLRVRRTMELAEGDGPLDVTLAVTNESDAPSSVRVKSHPEFYCQQRRGIPEIWLKDEGTWTRVNAKKEGTWAADFIPAKLPAEWGFYVPEKNVGLRCSVAEGDVQQLFYFYDTNAGVEQINLELVPTRDILEPGQTRTLRATYEGIDARPE
jgi:hypothetical protein